MLIISCLQCKFKRGGVNISPWIPLYWLEFRHVCSNNGALSSVSLQKPLLWCVNCQAYQFNFQLVSLAGMHLNFQPLSVSCLFFSFCSSSPHCSVFSAPFSLTQALKNTHTLVYSKHKFSSPSFLSLFFLVNSYSVLTSSCIE